jgi:hypothetical protein
MPTSEEYWDTMRHYVGRDDTPRFASVNGGTQAGGEPPVQGDPGDEDPAPVEPPAPAEKPAEEKPAPEEVEAAVRDTIDAIRAALAIPK